MSTLKSNLCKWSVLAFLGAITTLPLSAQQTATTPTTEAATEQAQAQIVTERINLNTASAQELEKGLLGIGAKKAQAIVEYREKNGNFISIDQLSDVSGIGKATLEKNRDLLSL
ncbi:ComEA family DNA-binding protein [Testudinibacter sp. TR-2022]|uniref:ComEA family DNA-binding protein n=1 Tax=Testudinibacter sp. TR-2022 TaxID=2585029 RepID=UPI00111AEB14|nr:ComEA family DNA-binding protein [Testudinibacter sp. TR-2022]TNH04232.1 ComEA family DNA-binding protein [Pasteurellaceae bacterium Phil31]TNH08607.1 ComEA family DNA-binding protein [Testudinibacter sp. TR-2022]TNH11093.1 ComEA family DNA-binding protein [Testudinibacter sp. TR-2022]TNH11439.1 ComEA family DNA-binding protein [Testudinibacter sp. TR-2022]TNH15616.1 ComEA family DNA-binding protein [Testudinibacter sp. TR-2022]